LQIEELLISVFFLEVIAFIEAVENKIGMIPKIFILQYPIVKIIPN
jgi:hypothetical protein